MIDKLRESSFSENENFTAKLPSRTAMLQFSQKYRSRLAVRCGSVLVLIRVEDRLFAVEDRLFAVEDQQLIL